MRMQWYKLEGKGEVVLLQAHQHIGNVLKDYGGMCFAAFATFTTIFFIAWNWNECIIYKIYKLF